MEELLFPEHEWDYVNRAVERVKLAWGFHHIIKKEIPSRHMPNTDGNYKHTSFEYRMAKTAKGKI